MRQFVACACGLLSAAAVAFAQSPSATETITVGGKTLSIAYSAPIGKDGRIGQDPTYPVWRAGANAGTKFHTDADLDLGGLAVPKGGW